MGAPRNSLVTVICPLLGNVARWSKQALLAYPPFRRYDTPFCTCKKRLKEGSDCQYSFDRHGHYRLDLVVDPELSSNEFPHPKLNTELHSRRIDVGCAQNHVCKRTQSGSSMISAGSETSAIASKKESVKMEFKKRLLK